MKTHMNRMNCLVLASCALLLNACAGDNTSNHSNSSPGQNTGAITKHNHSGIESADEPAHAGRGIADYADSINKGLITKDTMKGSPHRVAMANIGNVHVHIEYSSPGVKGRIIWGGLVPYETVWVTGAHGATIINFSKNVVIAGKQIPKGSYAFFTIPRKQKWIAILNSNYEQHLADEYKEQEDLVRVELLPLVNNNKVNRLNYTVTTNSATSGSIDMEWEKLKISLPVSISK